MSPQSHPSKPKRPAKGPRAPGAARASRGIAATPDAITEPWSIPAEGVLEALEVDRMAGLSASQVRHRRLQHGPNRLRASKSKTQAAILWDQLASPIVALLAVATAVAVAFDEQLEALAIGGVLVINTAIGFYTERRALRSMEALRDLGRRHTAVRRAGAIRVVPAEEIVPGDVVILDAGDVLTADLRIVTAAGLQADESALTGESLSVDKSAAAIPAETVLSDRMSMLYKGTAITRGSAEGVVVATGMATELGLISQLVEEAEPETTPLEERLERLGRRLVVLTLVLTAIVGTASVLSGRDLYLSIEVALALAVAAVPEGLPIVATMALARGMWRMARRNALVEQLSAVETLGSTSVLFVDKTGTLTENRMIASQIALPDRSLVTFEASKTGSGRTFVHEGVATSPVEISLLGEGLRVAALCNNAELEQGGDDPLAGVGDPTELALLHVAREAGFDRDALLAAHPEVAEIAFDSETKRMATVHRDGDHFFAAIKGAPETLIHDCTRIGTTEAEAPRDFDEQARALWLKRADEMASQGHRVLALATRRIDESAAAGDSPTASFDYADLTFLGLVGLLDPPRVGVREAILDCQAAGIRVVMVTGDHGGTARHIAAATGLIDAETDEPATVLDLTAFGDLDALSEQDKDRLLTAPVLARATPRQKLQLIALFQAHDAVVAMTGDGVNDAPALKKADIGIAMGKRGTEVAREAAKMVLRDDELGTIVAAVAQGRGIFSNIRKFVFYLLSCNLSEIMAVAVASIAHTPLPLLPLQILFLNLVTDVFPALALGVGEGAPSLMHDPPRDAREPLVTRSHWIRICVLGSAIAASALAALLIGMHYLGKTEREAATIAFLTLTLAQLWHVFSMRETGSSWLRNEVTRNRWIWGALGLCLGLVLIAVYWPPLRSILSIEDPGAAGWMLAFGMSLAPLCVGQLGLCIAGRTGRTGRAERESTG